MKKLKEKRVFIPLIIFFVSIIAVGGWLLISYRQASNPDNMVVKSDKLIAREIFDNYKGEMALSEFKERFEKHNVEKAYRQIREKDAGIIIKYWVKFKGENGYYLVHATAGEQVLVDSVLGKIAFPLDAELSTGERTFYETPVYYKLLTAVPKQPFNMTYLWISIGSMLVFVFLFWFIFGRVARGGGFTKAKFQDAKKPIYFEDVGGAEEALEDCREIVEMIKAGGRKNVKK